MVLRWEPCETRRVDEPKDGGRSLRLHQHTANFFLGQNLKKSPNLVDTGTPNTSRRGCGSCLVRVAHSLVFTEISKLVTWLHGCAFCGCRDASALQQRHRASIGKVDTRGTPFAASLGNKVLLSSHCLLKQPARPAWSNLCEPTATATAGRSCSPLLQTATGSGPPGCMRRAI